MKTNYRSVVIGVKSLQDDSAVSDDVLGMYHALDNIGVDVRLLSCDHSPAGGAKMIGMEAVLEFLGESGLFIYHFCKKWEAVQQLMINLQCLRILKYHNVYSQSISGMIPQHHDQKRDIVPRVILDDNEYLANYIWTDTPFDACIFEKIGFPTSRISTLYPFHNVDRLLGISPDKEWMSKINDGRINVLYVGQLAPSKKISLFVESFSMFKQHTPRSRMLISGKGEAEDASHIKQLAILVASLGLQEDVLFYEGPSEAVFAALYRSATMLAITSLDENVPVPLIQASAFGVPIVALSRSRLPENIQNLVEYCDGDDAEAFSSAMVRVLNPDRNVELSRYGRKIYWELFSIQMLEGQFLNSISPSLVLTSSRPVRAIHQFHSGSAVGDAITNSMFFTQKLLRSAGFESEIFVEHICKELKNLLKPHNRLRQSADEFVLIHHSMGHDLDEFVSSLGEQGALVYHNITPKEFFPNDEGVCQYIEKGLAQLDHFQTHFYSAIAVSSFNAHQLRTLGFRNIEVIPLLFDLVELHSRPWNDDLVQSQAANRTILFVGRIVPNKCPHELVDIAAELRNIIKEPFQIIVVGGFNPGETYYNDIRNRIVQQGLEQYIRFTGKISNTDLTAWYRVADLFLTLSEHEGFCVPVIEAMVYDTPVLAFDAGALQETMGGEGILLTRKNPLEIAVLIKLLFADRYLRRAIIRGQRERLQVFHKKHLFNHLLGFLYRQGLNVPSMTAIDSDSVKDCISPPAYQIEGPYETSYSLALVNREIAKALNEFFPGEVSLFATEGPGDYKPNQQLVNSLAGVRELQERGKKGAQPMVCIRNLYPPRVADMDGVINLLNFAWEESALPHAWCQAFNRHLDGLTVTSEYVRKVLEDNGVWVPSIAVGNGYDHLTDIKEIPLEQSIIKQLTGRFVFLHISSCFPRKGVDILLDAYRQAFTANDNVVLIIKTFSNPHNCIVDQINGRKSKNSNFPAVFLINRDVSDGELVTLYKSANAFVAPSRGEGFGLPMAEAMFFNIPVITTAYGGQSDFCTPKTAWLIDFSFVPASTHIGLYNSVWVEPSVSHLSDLLKEVYKASKNDIFDRCSRAKRMIQRQFAWKRCAERLVAHKNKISRKKPLSDRTISVAWFSTWNTKCGIAEYSSHLVEHLEKNNITVTILAQRANETIQPDADAVIRCWTGYDQPIDELLKNLSHLRPDILVLQFNFGFISQKKLSRLIDFCEQNTISTIIELHSTKDAHWNDKSISLRSTIHHLSKVDRLLLHSIDDLNRLKDYGSYKNTMLFPVGVLDWIPENDTRNVRLELNLKEDSFVIATYGFMLPHKGLSELVEAFRIIRNSSQGTNLLMLNALYPNADSNELHRSLLEKLASHPFSSDIIMITEYLDDQYTLKMLNAADLIVFPYMQTAESASAAVRHGLASEKPVLCTPLRIFQELSPVVHYTSGTRIPEIADSILQLINDPVGLKSKTTEQINWLNQNRYSILGKRLSGLIKGVLNHRK